MSEPVVITNEEYQFLVAEQFRLIKRKAESIILEPAGRNTAPALALAALKVLSEEDDAVLLVLAADHVIQNVLSFYTAVNASVSAAEKGKLVTFGVVPAHPETGYGYIKACASITENPQSLTSVLQFVEKPDTATAEQYLASGDYFWNSGMFLFKASRYLEELKTFRPDILTVCEQAMRTSHQEMNFVKPDKTVFEKCPEESIDYAVMEKTNDAVVMPLDAGWSDVGSWASLADLSEKDAQGNSTLGDVLLQETRNTYVRSENKLIATVGVKDLVITESDDAILVVHKDHTQDVKKVVDQLKKDQRIEVKKETTTIKAS
ncbi:Mannose-1-phosphate guanylyltransferase 1 [invertebrate metagenome]|uniref:Mannose-1-phosphate guanylyltransferase 1 n=1 Tax=invertebrate metagenome TaxID=1711999 RepID=A0A2H9T9M2_9ZZZZ